MEARFWSYVERTDGCWIWRGNISNKHGRFGVKKDEQTLFGLRKEVSAHLIAWWLTKDQHEKFVDRLCKNTLCVRPEHLVVRTPEERFWQKVRKTDGCWFWLGARSTSGYGSVWFSGKPYAAHRLAWLLTHRSPSLSRQTVLRHVCDNPKCVRPDHLIPGTQLDNVRDMIAKGRRVLPRGERAGLAKLTNEQVKVLRKAKKLGMTLDDLATLVGMTRLNVYHAIKGKSY